MATRVLGDSIVNIYYSECADRYRGTIRRRGKTLSFDIDHYDVEPVGFKRGPTSSEAYDAVAKKVLRSGVP